MASSEPDQGSAGDGEGLAEVDAAEVVAGELVAALDPGGGLLELEGAAAGLLADAQDVQLDAGGHALEGALELVVALHLAGALQQGGEGVDGGLVAPVAAVPAAVAVVPRLGLGLDVRTGPEGGADGALVVADLEHDDAPGAERERGLDAGVVHGAAVHVDRV